MMDRVSVPPRWRPEAHRRRGANSGNNSACFSDQLFGCTLCTVNDNDIVPRAGVRRLGGAWDAMEDPSYDLVDEDPDTDSGLEEAELEALERKSGLKSMAYSRSASIEEELEALIWNTGDLFATQGWDLVHSNGDYYLINGRKVRIFLLPSGTPLPDASHWAPRIGPASAQMAASIMVHDGPLRQPLLDYLMQTGKNEHYDARGTENPAAVTGMARNLDFAVPATQIGDRIGAMKHATVQADLRRRAASGETTARQNLFSSSLLSGGTSGSVILQRSGAVNGAPSNQSPGLPPRSLTWGGQNAAQARPHR